MSEPSASSWFSKETLSRLALSRTVPTEAFGVDLPTYRPKPWLFSGQLQTARVPFSKASGLHRKYPSRRLVLPLDDGSGDAMDCYHYWPADTPQAPSPDNEKPLFLLLHGLGGHAHSAYVSCSAESLLAAGYPVLMPNFRGAGSGRDLAQVLHHPGRSEDIDLLMRALERDEPDLVTPTTIAVGYSLGGHLLLKFLADYEVGTSDNHEQFRGAVTVSAPLALSKTSLALSRWANYPFNLYLLRKIKQDSLRENSNLTDSERTALKAARTVRQVDETVTGPRLGFDGAEAYYAANSAIDELSEIALPTVMIHSADDPFVPQADYDHESLVGNDCLDTVLLPDGGHVGFFTGQAGSRWLDRTLIELMRQRFWQHSPCGRPDDRTPERDVAAEGSAESSTESS